jgi:hypothetical protein
MAQLTYARRERLPDSAFALPEERKYPVHDLAHARNALARVAQHGTRKQQDVVRREVYRRYPHLKDLCLERPVCRLRVKKMAARLSR